MSFRRRLTLFFLLIVVVPMVFAGLVVFRLISDNETGKADARVAEASAVAQRLYRRESRRAEARIRTVATDGRLRDAVRMRDRGAARQRAQALLGELQLRRLTLSGGPVSIVVGSPTAIAVARLRLISRGSGRRVARVEVAALDAAGYAASVRRTAGVDVVVTRGARRLAATDAATSAGDLPDHGAKAIGRRDYRTASFRAGPVRVVVLARAGGTSSTISRGRLLAGLVLAAFLILAFAFALAVSRSLQAQIGRFLAGARRIAGGDFSTEVPTEGDDEFAALGDEFNKMSRQLEARLDELRQERARLQDSIRRIGETFAANLDRGGLLEIVVHTSVDALGAAGGRAIARERADDRFDETARAGELADFEDVVRTVEGAALADATPAECARDGLAAMAFPLRASDGDGGVLAVISVARRGEPFSPGERDLFHYLAGRAAVSIENVDLHELTQRQAVTDELTGLFNHRRFQEVVGREVDRAKRFGQSVGLLMLDIDNFKEVNDSHGHQQGDLVLRAVARVLRELSRDVDEPARYGGEELAVALPQTDLEGAFNLAERVREGIAGLRIERLDGGGHVQITASFGVAALPESTGDRDMLVALADAALYRAKRTGKNRTERAAPATATAASAE